MWLEQTPNDLKQILGKSKCINYYFSIMGLFSKIANTFLLPSQEKACIDQYMKYMMSNTSFNEEVLSCADVNYGSDVLRDFAKKYPIQCSSEFHGYVDIKTIVFEGQTYTVFYFMHYARAINVAVNVETKETDVDKLLEFVNQVNTRDFIDQVGLVEEDGKKYIRVFRQILLTPHIGSGDSIAEGLRALNDYALELAKLQYSGDDAWMKWANPKACRPVGTAADFWFKQDESSCLNKFSKGSKIIYKNEKTESHSMIYIPGHGSSFMAESPAFAMGNISTFSDFPYLSLLVVNITEDDPTIAVIKETSVMQFCSTWNQNIHFAPCKAVWTKNESGKITLSLIMTCMYADETNTRTYIDALSALHKATTIAVRAMRAK